MFRHYRQYMVGIWVLANTEEQSWSTLSSTGVLAIKISTRFESRIRHTQTCDYTPIVSLFVCLWTVYNGKWKIWILLLLRATRRVRTRDGFQFHFVSTFYSDSPRRTLISRFQDDKLNSFSWNESQTIETNENYNKNNERKRHCDTHLLIVSDRCACLKRAIQFQFRFQSIFSQSPTKSNCFSLIIPLRLNRQYRQYHLV